MTGPDRRELIITLLNEADGAISGGNLAKKLNVSRQIIVGDIALLRASGLPIVSTPKGYIFFSEPTNYITRAIVCKHTENEIEDELNCFVDEGIIVTSVSVEHGVYGHLNGDLHISSRRDVKDFIKNLQESKTAPLATLTDGIHCHTIKCKNEAEFDKIKQILHDKNFLYEL
ncbi:MAG: hypothetical protein ATN36_01490 [Epulopiscium sp. Nele67-Bin005]|nr:MAG: hypothetical protein ATN36_01490 [Epulopiscium sp. Nele67-Bin005]